MCGLGAEVDAMPRPMQLALGEGSPVGTIVERWSRPDEVGSLATLAERGRLHGSWLPEDLFSLGRIPSAGGALAETASQLVAFGATSPVVRRSAQPCAAYPGRYWSGVDIGSPRWLRRLNRCSLRRLATVGESMNVTQRLFAGACHFRRSDLASESRFTPVCASDARATAMKKCP